jgi:hypothetical protein
MVVFLALSRFSMDLVHVCMLIMRPDTTGEQMMQLFEGLRRGSALTPSPPQSGASLAPLTGISGRFSQGQYRLLLGRMSEQGHGIEALCFFLALTRDELSELIVQFDLPTPHDRPRRRSSGTRAWPQSHFEVLLDGWLNNWSAACIGDRLGRSRGSIWHQARRLGLPKRDRRALHWPQPVITDTPATPTTDPGRQRLPERWFVKGTDLPLVLTSKRNGLEVDWAANIEAYIDIGWRAFSGQRPSRIAEAYGVSSGTITSQIWWLHAKSPKRHKDFVDHFDRARGEANAKALGFQVRQCKVNSAFPYFYHKNEQVARRDKRNGKRGGWEF